MHNCSYKDCIEWLCCISMYDEGVQSDPGSMCHHLLIITPDSARIVEMVKCIHLFFCKDKTNY